MNDLPPPLTPARSDLRDFGFMPLEIVRFRGSDLLTEDADVVLAAILLWTAAWHETPAASLTDDDKALAKAAGFGRAVSVWLEVKEKALRGFVKCSDGRLYHPVVARLANEAWKGKVEQRHRTEVGRRKKWNERHPDEPLAIPSFETFAAHYPDNCPDDIGAMSPRQGALVLATEAQCRENVADDMASKGQGQGQGQGESLTTTPKPPRKSKPAVVVDDPPPEERDDLMGITSRLANAAGVSIIRPTAIAREMDIVKRWIADGIDVEQTILPIIAKRLADMRADETVGSLSYFDAPIRKALALSKGPKRGSNEQLPPLAAKDDDDERVAKIRDGVKARCGSRTYDGWLAPGKTAISINGVGLVVKARAGFMENWVRDHFAETFRAVALEHGIDDSKIVGVK